MGKLNTLISGLAGAITVNILNEGLKRQGKCFPRIDLLGEEALNNLLNVFDEGIKDPKKLYAVTLAGDLISNTIYYSMIGAGKKHIWTRAVFLGLSAGIGAIKLSKHLGLNEETVARNDKVKRFTILYYLAGALVAAGAIKALRK